MNDALKELFNAYKNLPVGVMFFKDETLFFVNEHLRSILLLDNLTSDDVMQVIGSMVGLENSSHSALNDFLWNNDIFFYRDRVIQIERQRADGMDIFVLVRISDKAIEAVDSTRSLRTLQEEKISESPVEQGDEHEILKEVLGEWEGVKFPSVVLYKGIPIKGDALIAEAGEGKIRLKVEKKQLAAAQPGADWLIGSKRDATLSGTVSRYDLAHSTVFLENLKVLDHGFHMRTVIRYYAGENDRFLFSIGGKKSSWRLRDVSEKGISVQTDDSAALVALSAAKGRTLDAQLVLDGRTLSVKAVWLYTTALEGSTMMKSTFTVGYDLHNGALLREWLNAQQLRLIKEVRNFVQMLSAGESGPSTDWVI